MKTEDEILISAYLDGELADDERQRVEQLLAGSAEARQLAEELRVVRARLQELPWQRLDADFAAQVLGRTEQETTGEGKSASTAAAVADRTSSQRSPAHDAQQTGDVVSPPPRSVWTTWRGLAWPAVVVAAAIVILVTNRPQDDAEKRVARVDAAKQQPQAAAPEIAAREPKPADKLQTEGFERDDRLDAGAATAPAPAGGGIGGASQPAPANSTLHEGLSKSVARPSRDADADADNLLVVQVGMTPEAARRGAFDELLAKHRIALDDELSEEAESAKQRSAVSGRTRGAASLERADDGRRALRTKADLDRYAEAQDVPTDASAGLDVVYVEATPAQVTAALRDLASASESFPTVAVTAPGRKVEADRAAGRATRLALPSARVFSPPPQPAAEAPPAAAEAPPTEAAPLGLQPQPAPMTLAAPAEDAASFGGGGLPAPRMQRAVFVLRIVEVPASARPLEASPSPAPAEKR